MSNDDASGRSRQWLSALVDGDGDAEFERACRAWRDDASVRADWHAYHLVGELMRSDDVRCAPQHDAEFLRRLRERLAAEPVVLAPAAAAIRRTTWRSAWVAPTAVAAGFVAVAGVLAVTRAVAPDGAAQDRSALMADTSASAARMIQPVALAPAGVASMAGVTAAEGSLIRDAELDRYLSAHKQYATSSALVAPGGVLRSTVVAPGR